MTTKTQQIVARIKAAEKEMAAVKAELKAQERWPKKGDWVYYINEGGYIEGFNFGIGDQADYSQFEYGNCFKTQKEAESECNMVSALLKLRRAAREAGAKGRPPETSYHIYYGREGLGKSICHGPGVGIGSCWFPTAESRDAAFESLTEEEKEALISL
jgi:hypothetical protein